ncbi:MAG: hypothetical protein MI757_12640 [Pirellulales bacterium]|nr:hypothetical protein [Pirellulales bacterium]
MLLFVATKQSDELSAVSRQPEAAGETNHAAAHFASILAGSLCWLSFAMIALLVWGCAIGELIHWIRWMFS